MDHLDKYTKEQLKDLLAELYVSYPLLFRTLFPDIFTRPFHNLHFQIFDFLQKSEKRCKLILAPRGIGKTSIVKGIISKKILFRDAHFIMYVSNTLPIAVMQTEAIKRGLLTNKTVRKLFGNIKENIRDFGADVDDVFSKEAWVAYGDTIVVPRGCNQQIRGSNWNNYRPDLIILDDPENRKELRNEVNREENRRWLFGDVLYAPDRGSKNWEVIYIDTLKHEDSLPMHLMNHNEWDHIVLSICDEDYKSKVPEFISDEELQTMLEGFRNDGTLDIFYQEYMNMPVATETASFHSQYFKYYEEADLANGRHVENVILVDPAKTATPQSADSAVVCVGIDTENHQFFIRDIVSGKFYPEQLYEEVFSMASRMNCSVIGLEVTGLNEFILYPFKNEMLRRGLGHIELIELKPRRSKEERISALIPFYRQGQIYHNKACCAKLEGQLLSFPHSALWDVMDATAYLAEMMDIGGRFFLATFEHKTPEDVEAEYRSLLTEDDLKDPEVEWELV